MKRLLFLIAALIFVLPLSIPAEATEIDGMIADDTAIISEDAPTDTPVIAPTACEHDYSGNWQDAGDVHSIACTKCGNIQSENHWWNSGIYIVEPTCSTGGSIRYSCINCMHERVEELPATGVHVYKNAQQVDASTHVLTCPGCNDTKTEAHTWNGGHQYPPATCASEGQMEYRCTQCATYKHEPIPKTNDHAFGAWGGDEYNHSRSCTNCGKVESGAHSWYGGTVVLAPTCNEPGVMGYLCGGCDMVLLEEIPMRTAHIYDNDCDADCNSCGATRATGHKYATTYTKSATGHWYACTVCGDKKDASPHIPGPAATESADQTCNACGYIIKSRLNHTHSYQKVWTNDEEGHWYACTGCAVQKDFKTHTYDDACDADCNVCGYITKTAHTYDGTWQTDENGHWAVCTVCDVESTHEAHIPGPEATEAEPQTCTTCSYILTPVQEHKHFGGDTWINDAEKHWKVCECGEIMDEAIHVWDDGTGNDDATITYACKGCGLTKTEGEPTVETTEPIVPVEESKESNLIYVAFIAIVAALIGASIALVNVLKPKKKGRFTK